MSGHRAYAGGYNNTGMRVATGEVSTAYLVHLKSV